MVDVFFVCRHFVNLLIGQFVGLSLSRILLIGWFSSAVRNLMTSEYFIIRFSSFASEEKKAMICWELRGCVQKEELCLVGWFVSSAFFKRWHRIKTDYPPKSFMFQGAGICWVVHLDRLAGSLLVLLLQKSFLQFLSSEIMVWDGGFRARGI